MPTAMEGAGESCANVSPAKQDAFISRLQSFPCLFELQDLFRQTIPISHLNTVLSRLEGLEEDDENDEEDPRNAITFFLWLLGRQKEAENSARRIVETNKGNEVLSLSSLAWVLWRVGGEEGAERALDDLEKLQEQPQKAYDDLDADAQSYMIYIQRKCEDFLEPYALSEQQEQLLNRRPENDQFKFYLASTYKKYTRRSYMSAYPHADFTRAQRRAIQLFSEVKNNKANTATLRSIACVELGGLCRWTVDDDLKCVTEKEVDRLNINVDKCFPDALDLTRDNPNGNVLANAAKYYRITGSLERSIELLEKSIAIKETWYRHYQLGVTLKKMLTEENKRSLGIGNGFPAPHQEIHWKRRPEEEAVRSDRTSQHGPDASRELDEVNPSNGAGPSHGGRNPSKWAASGTEASVDIACGKYSTREKSIEAESKQVSSANVHLSHGERTTVYSRKPHTQPKGAVLLIKSPKFERFSRSDTRVMKIIDHFNRALELGGSEHVYYDLGLIHKALTEYGNALNTFKQVIEQFPASVLITQTLEQAGLTYRELQAGGDEVHHCKEMSWCLFALALVTCSRQMSHRQPWEAFNPKVWKSLFTLGDVVKNLDLVSMTKTAFPQEAQLLRLIKTHAYRLPVLQKIFTYTEAEACDEEFLRQQVEKYLSEEAYESVLLILSLLGLTERGKEMSSLTDPGRLIKAEIKLAQMLLKTRVSAPFSLTKTLNLGVARLLFQNCVEDTFHCYEATASALMTGLVTSEAGSAGEEQLSNAPLPEPGQKKYCHAGACAKPEFHVLLLNERGDESAVGLQAVMQNTFGLKATRMDDVAAKGKERRLDVTQTIERARVIVIVNSRGDLSEDFKEDIQEATKSTARDSERGQRPSCARLMTLSLDSAPLPALLTNQRGCCCSSANLEKWANGDIPAETIPALCHLFSSLIGQELMD